MKAIEYPCLKCGADTEKEGGHAFWEEEGGVCDHCAEEVGCECGCFPPPGLRLYADTHNLSLERVTKTGQRTRLVPVPARFEAVSPDEEGAMPLQDPQTGRILLDEHHEPVFVRYIPETSAVVTWTEEWEEWELVE